MEAPIVAGSPAGVAQPAGGIVFPDVHEDSFSVINQSHDPSVRTLNERIRRKPELLWEGA
jgi:hypothetical protein